MSECIPPLKFLNTVNEAAVFSLFSLNVTQNSIRIFNLNCSNTEFHADQLKTVQENEVKRFCFALTLWPQGQWKWYKMADVNGAYKQCRYEKLWFKSLWVMSNFKVFAAQDGRPAGRTRLITWAHMLHIWLNKRSEIVNAIFVWIASSPLQFRSWSFDNYVRMATKSQVGFV